MDLLVAAAALAAIAGPAALVLRDVAGHDRPPAPEPEAGPALPVEAAEMTVAPVLGVGRIPLAEPLALAATVPVEAPEPAPVPEPLPVAKPAPPPVEREPVFAPSPDSMLSGLTTTEADERSAFRRVASLVVLLTFTAGAAAAVAAVIYKGVSGLG